MIQYTIQLRRTQYSSKLTCEIEKFQNHSATPFQYRAQSNPPLVLEFKFANLDFDVLIPVNLRETRLEQGPLFTIRKVFSRCAFALSAAILGPASNARGTRIPVYTGTSRHCKVRGYSKQGKEDAEMLGNSAAVLISRPRLHRLRPGNVFAATPALKAATASLTVQRMSTDRSARHAIFTTAPRSRNSPPFRRPQSNTNSRSIRSRKTHSWIGVDIVISSDNMDADSKLALRNPRHFASWLFCYCSSSGSVTDVQGTDVHF